MKLRRGSVYIGLTYNIEKRTESHYKNTKSQVKKHITKTESHPKLIKLSNYIDVELAKIKEGEYIELYRKNNWNILNNQKAGNVGGLENQNLMDTGQKKDVTKNL